MEKTIQITLTALQALLREQAILCSERALCKEDWHRGKYCGSYADRESISNAPLVNLSHLKEVKNDVTNEPFASVLKRAYKQWSKQNKVVGRSVYEFFNWFELWLNTEPMAQNKSGQQLTECYVPGTKNNSNQ